MKHLFIVNPSAGRYNRSKEVADKVAAVMAGRRLDWQVQETQARGHAIQLVREAAQKGDPLRVYACGGDGTLNEVVNGAAGFDNAAVTHYPIGSGNDFIKIFGPDAPLFYDLHQLVEGEQAPLDLIDCNGRLSINICSVGLDARVGLGMEEFKRYPFVSGQTAYLLSLLKQFVLGIHRPYRIRLDGEEMSGDFTLIAACNGRYYGGSFHPAPHADPDDGLLEFLIVRAVSRLTVARVVREYASGGAAGLPQYVTLRRGKAMEVICDRPSLVNVDGERLDAELLSFRLSAKKVNFFYPPGTHWRPDKRGLKIENTKK